MHADLERRLAIAELLAQSDPPELQRRGHRVRFDGKPERYALLPTLSALYVQRKLLALEERRDASVESVPDNIHWERYPVRQSEVLMPA